MLQLRLVDPHGYLALHPQALAVTTVGEAAAVAHHLRTVIAVADAAAPWAGPDYQPHDYTVHTTALPEEPMADKLPCARCKGAMADPDDPGDWVPEVGMHNPYSGSPCSVCNGEGEFDAMTDERLNEIRAVGADFATVAEVVTEVDRLRVRIDHLESERVSAELLVQRAIDKDTRVIDAHEMAEALGMNGQLGVS